jgi:hypothetical protein
MSAQATFRSQIPSRRINFFISVSENVGITWHIFVERASIYANGGRKASLDVVGKKVN